MKHLLLAATLLCIVGEVQASPYFRLIDPGHVYRVAGAFIDPTDPGNTSVGSAVALVTHSVRDGQCLLPSVVCEDWSPLMVGLSVNSGRLRFDMGPAVNLTPMAKVGLLGILRIVTAEGSLVAIKGLLGSQPISGPDVSVSFGPALSVNPIDHGAIMPANAWKGRFVIFAGAALKF